MKVIQCSDCNPPCTFPYKEGWDKPVLCAFWDEKDGSVVEGNYEIKDITEEELLEIYK